MSETFIGKCFDTPKGGKITVVGRLSKSKGRCGKYLCKCSICSLDAELFPDLFEANKADLNRPLNKPPIVPCGCSRYYWNESQYKVRVKRECVIRGYTLNGWAGKYKGAHTKLDLYNPCTGNTWYTTDIHNFFGGRGDPEQAKLDNGTSKRIPEARMESQIRAICTEEELTFIGWGINGYVNSRSKPHWLCKEGHFCDTTTSDHFINEGHRCITCARLDSNFNGYYPERAEEKDFLYIMDIQKCIKLGRSFTPKRRSYEVKYAANITFNPETLQLLTASHKVVYDTEQEILKELRKQGFNFDCSWTNECLTYSGLVALQNLLDGYIKSGVLSQVCAGNYTEENENE